MTKEEIETTFTNHPYFAYKQGLQDGMAYTWDSFRREATKDFVAAMLSNATPTAEQWTTPDIVNAAIEIADELIKQLKEGRHE